MKILWISHLVPYPPKGGVLQRSHHLLHQVSKEFDVDLLAFHQPKLMAPMFKNVDEGLDIAKRKLSEFCDNVDVYDIPAGTSNFNMGVLALKSLVTPSPYNINWLKSKSFSEKLSHLLKTNSYDLVHFDTISLYPYLDLVPAGIATSLDHHNVESHMLLRRSDNEKNILKKFYFKQEGYRLEKFEREFCERVSINITCSDIDTERLQLLAPKANILTIPNGVDIDFFSPTADVKEKNSNKKIVFIGRLNWYPNRKAALYIAEKIWPLLKRDIPGVQCDIIGANPPPETITLSENDPSFNVHGFVDDIHPYMSSTTIYVCPISDGGGTKLKIIDALAMAMPIVAHPISCEGINVEENSNVLFAKEPEEFSAQISKLFDDQLLMKRLGENARKLAEDTYSYNAIGTCLRHSFVEVINSNSE